MLMADLAAIESIRRGDISSNFASSNIYNDNDDVTRMVERAYTAINSNQECSKNTKKRNTFPIRVKKSAVKRA